MDDVPKEHLVDIYTAQISIHFFDDLCKKGAKIHDFKVTEPDAHDVIQLSYTSGTTGDPKGVIITHRCILSANESCQIRFRESGKPLDEKDCYISYLPAAHIFEATLFTNWWS
jgi:long-chain acyl-CoA synthetase